MTKRGPIGVFLLSLLTCGIYAVIWQVNTKDEMNSRGAEIPTAWLMIIPFINIFWMWKYCEGVEKVTNGQMSGAVAFLLLFLTGPIGMAILQSKYNELGSVVPAVTKTNDTTF